MAASRAPGAQSLSKQQRQYGNSFFKSSQEGFGFIIQSGRLESALEWYRCAYSCSDNDDDAVSAIKNIAMATWKLASLHGSVTDRDQKVQKIIARRHFNDALRNFNKALLLKSCKTAAWTDHLQTSMQKCGEEAIEWINKSYEDEQEKMCFLTETLAHMSDGKKKAEDYIQLATHLFGQGLTALGELKYKECFRFMKECYFPIQEAARMCGKDPTILSEVEVLKEDVHQHTCLAEAGKARATGDALLETGLKDNVDLNVELVWSIMDWYRQSAILCKGSDIEQEAIAYSRMGRIYGKVLKLTVKGKNCHKRAIELALSMAPRNFHNVDWFEESKKYIEEFQKRLDKGSEENKEKDAALADMKADLDKLKGFSNLSPEEYVVTLYKTWPPKAPGATLNEKLATKKLLLKAISHYHPDKVDKEVHGKKWYYFTEEITKCLNDVYMKQKFSDVE
ncbi:uncharacterized protein LOC121412197 [Lytechinus variegatus]|uniref:uncharacterized protein LOC121412197 n=1 Tax=Lytechinus variegatus TaxID=7654 RepID=UPI001BB1720F|nr:uncharacterized protein LOC121412197 [Lytechinus variegatus]